jgi:hypothetical protein
MIAQRIILITVMMGLAAGCVLHRTASASNGPGKPGKTKKAYDLLGISAVEAGAPANSLLPPDTVVLYNDFQGMNAELKSIHNAYEKHKTELSLDNIIICIQHKKNSENTQSLGGLIHSRFPGIRVAVTGSFPEKDLQAHIDLYIPEKAELSASQLKDAKDFQRVRDCIEAVRQRKHQNRYSKVMGEAKKMLAPQKGIIPAFKQAAAERKKLNDLLAKFVPLSEPYEKWDKGAMSLDRAVEVRLARQTARRRKALFQRHVKACETLKVKSLSQKEWDALWPKRILFSQDFEGPPTKAFDWDGEIVTDNVPKGSKRALGGKVAKKYFARRTRTGIYFDNARSTTKTWVSFDYFINKNIPIGVFVFSMTQGDNCRYKVHKPVVGKWTQTTIQVGGDGKRIKAGEGLDDVFIHAGKPGDKDLVLIVDNVKLIGLD